MRCALILCGVIAARAAHADPCPAPAAAPADATPRRMAVELGDGPDAGGTWTRTLVPSGTAQFPAVSEDGRTIVELFHDEQDFVGTPIATVVFFSKARRVASFELDSDNTDASHATSADQAELEARVMAEVNARLGLTRWRPLLVAVACETDDGASSSVDLGDGLHVRFGLDNQQLVVLRDHHRPRGLRATFPAAGHSMDRDTPGPCGGVVGLDRAFGSIATGFAVVVPHVNLGGDSCFGVPSASLAIAVRIP